VKVLELTAPVAFIGDSEERLRAVRVMVMEQGPPDESGRRRPVPVPGSERDIPVEVVIIAAGNDPNPLLRRTTPDLHHEARGTVTADPATGQTSKPGVFAGGDIVTGGATVILAMGAGRRAAAAIHDYLTGGALVELAG
jgi:glutamate synthase (NADPH/NADH) small chain